MGKMGAKRHANLDMRDPIQRITSPAIRRLCRRAGIKRINKYVYEEIRGVIDGFTENMCKIATTYMSHARRSTLCEMDIIYTSKRMGKTLYVATGKK